MKPAGARSFTLVELMVAAVITSLLLLGMTGIFDQSMKAWRLASRRADAEREVRAALGTIQRDLRGLWVETNVPAYRFTNRVPTPDYVRFPRTPELAQSVSIFFLSTQSADAQPDAGNVNRGDLCGVGYYVAWDGTANDRKGAYNLYRYFQPSGAQLGHLIDFLDLSGPIAGRTRLFRESTIPDTRDEIVGANVVNFRAEFKCVPPFRARSPLVAEFNGPLILAPRGTRSYLSTQPRSRGDTFSIGGNTLGVVLEDVLTSPSVPTNSVLVGGLGYVQLELTAYGSEAVRTFTRSNDWLNSDNIKKFGRAFLWRVDL
jgi:type II secretory pathway pseudopilin PulG